MSGIVPRTNKAEASVTSSTGSRNRNEKLPAGETPREKIDRSTSNGTSGWVEDSLPLPRRRRLEEQEKNNDDNNYNYNYYNRNNDVGDSENENENNNNSNNNSSSYYHNYWENWADQVAEKTEFDSNLIKADDVSVNEVVTAFYYNIIVFILLMAFYEVMRRVAPAVYSSRQKRKNQRIAFGTNNTGTSNTHNNNSGIPPGTTTDACRTGDTENNKSTGGSKSGGTRTEQHTTPPSSTQTQNSEATTTHENNNNKNDTSSMNSSSNAFSVHEDHNHNNNSPLDWLFWNAHSVLFGVSWNHVRHVAGLDGYFFLRFIRMNVRITAVSTVWLCATLIPLYTMGHQVNRDAADQQQAAADAASSSSSSSTTVIYTAGWYHLSAANVDNNSRAMWIPCLALYLFTGFIFFVVSQEYRHYLEIRQDFLAKGTIHVHPQHHYSVLVENIPAALRSDAALAQYFNHLFPHGNTVHSAVMMYKWPNLELASAKCTRSCRRLEKSIAYYHAEQRRPTHVVGRGRVTILGIDLAPLEECTQPCTHALKLDGIMPGDDGDGYFDDSDDDENEIHIIATTKNDNASSSIIQSGASISTLMDAKKSNDKNSSNNYYIELDDDKDKTVSALPFWRQRPKKGTRVDSIAYYTQELAAHSRTLFRMQQRQAAGLLAMEQQQYDTLVGNPANGTSWDYFSPMEPKHPTAVSDAIFSPDPAGAEAIIVESGNDHPNENTATKSGGGSSGSNNLFGCMVERVVQEAHDVVNQIMDDSVLDNALIAPSDAYYFDNDPDDQPKHATLKNRRGQKQVSFPYRPPNEKSKEGVDNTIVAPSRYGSISPPGDRSNRRVDLNDNTNNYYAIDDTATQHLRARIMKHSGGGREHNNVEAANEEDDVPYFDEVSTQSEEFVVPFANNENQNLFRRLLGRLGLDFFVFILRCVTQQVQVSLEGVMSDRSPVSRTGFVTFLDLASTTCAASAPLTVKANVLDVTMAPEPRVSFLLYSAGRCIVPE